MAGPDSLLGEGEWLARCAAEIMRLDPAVPANDADELARDLWDRPSCRLLTPEEAAERLYSGRLSSKDRGQEP